MSDFETILLCLIIPFIYVFVYIAGKYDLLYLVCKMLEEKCKKYMENNDD